LESPVKAIRKRVRETTPAHIDETSRPEACTKAWLLVTLTVMTTTFTIVGSQGAEVIKQVLAISAEKLVISERLKNHGWDHCRRFCLAEHRRDFQAMIDRGGHSARLFERWHRVRDGTMARCTFRFRVAILGIVV
jgi:hypothetical protein